MGTPPGVARRARWLIILALGCSAETEPPLGSAGGGAVTHDDACSVAQHVEVPLDVFGELGPAPSVVPLGDRFGVVGGQSASLSRSADVALVSWRGVDRQSHFLLAELCPDDICRNEHGTAILRTATGGLEFLLVEQGSAVSMQAYPLRLLAWSSERSEAAITPLFEARVGALTTRNDLKSSRDGTRALFVLGNIDSPLLQVVEIAKGAALVAPAASLMLPSSPWDCLAVVPTEKAGAISAVTRSASGTEVTWHLRELDAEANLVFDTSATVPVGEALGYTDCPAVVDSPEGFHAQWVNAGEATVIASVKRAAGAGEAPALLSLDVSPGALEAMLHGEFLFRAPLGAEHQEFLRLKLDGEPGGPPVTLPVLLPESTSGQSLPKVLRVEGPAVDVSYALEGVRVFEEFNCP